MTEKELLQILENIQEVAENEELEFKGGKGGFPGSFWETYSAFANTNGGVCIIGLKERKGQLVSDNLTSVDIDQLQKDLWSGLANKNKINVNLLNNADVRTLEFDDSYLLIIKVPRASRDQRPIHMGLDPYNGTYRRGYEGDFRCTRSEVQRIFADADKRNELKNAGYDISYVPYSDLTKINAVSSKSKQDDYVIHAKSINEVGIWFYNTNYENRMFVSSMSFSIRPGKTCYTLNQRKATHDSIRLSPATIIYFLIFFPGSITRYHPYMFESILSDKDIWMIGEFLKTQPPQFMNMLLSKLLSTPVFGSRMPLQSEG